MESQHANRSTVRQNQKTFFARHDFTQVVQLIVSGYEVMKPVMFYLLLLFLSFTACHSSQKVRGLSSAGRITNSIIPAESEEQGIECNLSYRDPSGNDVLSEGETGIIRLSVKNIGDAIIKPKLEIAISYSWNPKPHSRIKRIQPLRPRESREYRFKVRWKKEMPSGIITYRVKAFDTNSGLVSSPAQVSLYVGEGGSEKSTFVDVDKFIPKYSNSNKHGVAVIIGNRDYTNRDIPKVDYAISDARTVKQYLVNMFGFREGNIILVENAEKIDFETIFGSHYTYQGKLYKRVKPNQSDVFIYYSGHGAPVPDVNSQSHKAYFVPSNCDPNFLEIGGYPLDLLYRNLKKVPAKSITVVLDACFSGNSPKGPLIKFASSVGIRVRSSFLTRNSVLFTSATGDQIASWYPRGNHSLFTYYFLRALRGEADRDSNRQITVKELEDYLKEHVSYMARWLRGREQNPRAQALDKGKKVIVTY